MLDVVEIVLKTLVNDELSISAQLPEPGDARQHAQALSLIRCVLFYDVWHFGTRSHQRHLSLQYIQQLRQLVEARLAQKPACRRDPRVAAVFRRAPILGDSRIHGAKLIYCERLAVPPDPLLPEEHWPA